MKKIIILFTIIIILSSCSPTVYQKGSDGTLYITNAKKHRCYELIIDGQHSGIIKFAQSKYVTFGKMPFDGNYSVKVYKLSY